MATSAEIDALEAAALANATAGLASSTVDGVSAQALDPIKQFDAVDRAKSQAAQEANSGVGFILGRRAQARFRGPGQ